MEQSIGSKFRKENIKAVYCHATAAASFFLFPFFILYVEYIMRIAGLDKAQAESVLQGELSITSDMQMTPPLRQK